MKTKRSFLKTILLTLFATTSLLTARANDTDTIRFTWEASEGESKIFFLKVPKDSSYIVDWGNDSIETWIGTGSASTDIQGVRSPLYSAGTYTVTVTGSKTVFLEFQYNYHPIKSLNLYNCTTLKYLLCFGNELTSLDVSGCTALESLECHDNKLTYLNVSGCTALRQMYCYNNNLTSLDVSTCDTLAYLQCSHNQLNRLNINKNMYVNCNNNQLLLSELYDISLLVISQSHKVFGSQYLASRQIVTGDTIDFSTQAAFGNPDTATVFTIEKDSLPALLNVDYTINNGVITFHKAGDYTVSMTNEAIISHPSIPAEAITAVNVSGVGITENTLPEIRVYPNPTKDKLRIENGKLRMEKIEVYDILGKVQNAECRMQNFGSFAYGKANKMKNER